MKSKLFLKKTKSFTLLELLIVIFIVTTLSGGLMPLINSGKARARDAQRIQTLDVLESALDRYFIDNGHYPYENIIGEGFCGFSYNSCGGGSLPSLKFDNSASGGWLEELFDKGYTSIGDWNDPFDPVFAEDSTSAYNCRYVFPCPSDPCNPQQYLLHCKVESSPDVARNDGGTQDDYYEIVRGWRADGKPWICISGMPSN